MPPGATNSRQLRQPAIPTVADGSADGGCRERPRHEARGTGRRERRHERAGEVRRVDRRVKRGDGNRGQRGLRARRVGGTLEPLHEAPRDQQHGGRTARRDALEGGLRQTDQLAVADGDDGRGSRSAGEQGHLPDDLAAANLGDQHAAGRPADEDAQPPLDHHVERVGSLTLTEQGVAALQPRPLGFGLDGGAGIGVEAAEQAAGPGVRFDRVERATRFVVRRGHAFAPGAADESRSSVPAR